MILTNTTATLAALQALATARTPVRIWRDKGNGAAAALNRDGIITRAYWLPDVEQGEFGVHFTGLNGEFSTALSLPPWHPWSITPLTTPTPTV